MSLDFDTYIIDLFASTEEPWTLEKYGAMVHQSAWPDLVSKAKRLIADGQVQILRNAPEHVWGFVIGDHGSYNTEFSRQDPNSQVIDQWSCDCPWDQFAFNRTRKWKKFEGRVCSHLLSTYWRAMSVPLDAGYEEQAGKAFQKQGPPVQRTSPPMIPPAHEPGQNEVQRLQELRERSMERQRNNQPLLPGENEQMQFEPFAPTQQGEQKPMLPEYPRPWEGPPPTDQELLFGQPPESPFRYPEAPQMQREDFQTFDVAQPWTPTPVPPENQLSIFGGDPPDPADPFSGIGFSSIPYGTKRIFDSWWYANKMAATSDDDFLLWYQNCKEQGKHPAAQVVSRDVYLEARGGKQPAEDAEPSGYFPDGTPRYRMMDLGYDPATGERVRSTEGGDWGPGAPEQRGVMMEVPINSHCEVIDVDPLLKWAYIIIPTNSSFSRLEPSNLVGWVGFGDLKPLDDPHNVFIRRR